LALNSIRSGPIPPPALDETGHFYFAQTGHSHFAATHLAGHLDMTMFDRYSGPQREELRKAREARMAYPRKQAVAA
jgi:hypothetical protein